MSKFLPFFSALVLCTFNSVLAQTDGVQIDYSVTPPARSNSEILELNSTNQGSYLPCAGSAVSDTINYPSGKESKETRLRTGGLVGPKNTTQVLVDNGYFTYVVTGDEQLDTQLYGEEKAKSVAQYPERYAQMVKDNAPIGK